MTTNTNVNIPKIPTTLVGYLHEKATDTFSIKEKDGSIKTFAKLSAGTLSHGLATLIGLVETAVNSALVLLAMPAHLLIPKECEFYDKYIFTPLAIRTHLSAGMTSKAFSAFLGHINDAHINGIRSNKPVQKTKLQTPEPVALEPKAPAKSKVAIALDFAKKVSKPPLEHKGKTAIALGTLATVFALYYYDIGPKTIYNKATDGIVTVFTYGVSKPLGLATDYIAKPIYNAPGRIYNYFFNGGKS